MYLFKLNCNFSSSRKRSCNLHKALKRSHCKTVKRPKTTNKRSMMYNVSYFQKDKLTFDGPCTTRYWAFYKICVLLDACHCIGGIRSMKYICAQICLGDIAFILLICFLFMYYVFLHVVSVHKQLLTQS